MTWTEIMDYIAIVMFGVVVLLLILSAALCIFIIYGECFSKWYMKRKRYTTSQEKGGTISHRKKGK